jgi:hypothetical protein
MSEPLMYRCTPRKIRRYVERCMLKGLVPMIESSPAMGKSAVMALIAKDYHLKLIDHRVSTSLPEDVNGLPNFQNGKATFSPFDIFPTVTDEIPEGYQGWFLFLDEFNSGNKTVLAAYYKVLLDRMVGQHPLHPNLVMACAGNLASDRAIVNQLGTALQSRLVWLQMELEINEFLEDVAFAQNWDPRIISYLSWKGKSALHDFRPDHQEKTFCAPRTWEFMNKLIKNEEVVEEDAALYAGTITSGVAVDFIQFTKVFNELTRIEQVVKDPEGARIGKDSPTKFANMTHLIQHVDDDSFEKVATYVNRHGAEHRTLFFRGLMVQKPDLKKHPAFRKALVELSRYLNDDDAPAAVAA